MRWFVNVPMLLVVAGLGMVAHQAWGARPSPDALILKALDEDKAPAAAKPLQGRWTVIAMFDERGKRVATAGKGEVFSSAEFAESKVKLTWLDGEESLTEEALVELDVAGTSITLVLTTSDDKGRAILGIYERKGDTLKLALTRPGAVRRPREFASSRADEIIAVELQRAKAK